MTGISVKSGIPGHGGGNGSKHATVKRPRGSYASVFPSSPPFGHMRVTMRARPEVAAKW